MTLSISSRNPIRMPVSPLQILILIQIDERPKYGYEILKNLRDAFEGVWEPKTGTVYPALKSLEKKGYITVETRGDADYYKITHKGEQLFDDMLNHMDKSIDFSIKYISVVFRWLTKERKESAINFLEAMTHKERLLSDAND